MKFFNQNKKTDKNKKTHRTEEELEQIRLGIASKMMKSEPTVDEALETPDDQEVESEPAVDEALETPDDQEIETEPAVDEAQETPDDQEEVPEPTVDAAQEIPDDQEVESEPAVDEALEIPEVQESETTVSSTDVSEEESEISFEDEDENGMVTIELQTLVEFNGKYHKGVQSVTKELAKKLLEIDKEQLQSKSLTS